ncbi:hypothetical protein BOTBODRAFT_27602 [Botryobasidium botryosum FD-172 SS1]|uniref:Helicase SWR1 n=1 Tax=Botryobasidium botryosum (strain FD-172 SS1) TaxID=930990 RepID=A0A067MZQ8_BOTB1|nr:hypothetical protein BOTBODRAFT_27602 [Botryobasidium botryosum FD-172 SS1]
MRNHARSSATAGDGAQRREANTVGGGGTAGGGGVGDAKLSREAPPSDANLTSTASTSDIANVAPQQDEPSTEEVGVQREELLKNRRDELAGVVDRHDDLVREAFHLERFVTLVGFDPKEAKADTSPVFEQYRAPYDLVANTAGSSGLNTPARKTRRAVTNRRVSLISTPSTPSTPLLQQSTSQSGPPLSSGLSNGKGKGKAREVFLPPQTPLPKNTGLARRGSQSSLSSDHHNATPSESNYSKRKSSGSMVHDLPPPKAPPTPAGRRPPKSAIDPALGLDDSAATPVKGSSKGHHRAPLKRTASSLVSPDPGASSGVPESPSSSAQPQSTPFRIKRIKLTYRVPAAEYTDPSQFPPKPEFNHSLSALLTSYITLEEDGPELSGEHLDALASSEAVLRNKISALQRQGRLLNPNGVVDRRPSAEPKRAKDHRDCMLEHMAAVSKLIRDEGRARVAGAKKLSKLVLAYFEKKATADDRDKKAQGKRMRALAKSTLKLVLQEWKLAVKHVRDIKAELEKAEKARQGKIHLDAILEQSTQVLEAQHMDLTHSRSRSTSASASHLDADRMSVSRSRSMSRDAGEESDSGTEQEKGAEHSDEDDEDDDGMDVELKYGESFVADSPRMKSPEDEDGRSPIPSAAQSSIEHPKGRTSRPSASPRLPSSPVPAELDADAGGSDFSADEAANQAQETQDVQFDAEMESDEYDSDEEIGGLGADADAPIEELMRRYGYPAVAQNDDAEGDDVEMSSPEEGANGRSPSLVVSPGPEAPTTSNRRRRRPSGHPQLTSSSREPDQDSADRDFQVENGYEEDAVDRQLDEEMDSDDEDDVELNGLGEDADLPIEELMKRYGYEPAAGDPSQAESSEDDDADSRSELYDDHISEDEGARHSLKSTTPSKVSVQSPAEDKHLASGAGSPTSIRDPTPPISLPSASVPTLNGNHISSPPPASDTVLRSPAPSTSYAVERTRDPSSPLPSHAEDTEMREGSPSGDGMQTEEQASSEISTKIKPPFLLRGTLRPYQQAGLEWLASLYSNKLNGILADEMGLGKTIQTISLLAHLACDKGIWGPHLIIVPTSVLLNWEMEFKKFFPGFKVITYYGNVKERKERRIGWNTEHYFNVCITSYQLVLADQHIFRRKPWVYMILDEAHNIKNFRSQRWQTLLGFNSAYRLLLTGTPLQNTLMELWSLLYFLMPKGINQDLGEGTRFADHKEFAEWFSNPMNRAIENGQSMDEETRAVVQRLHKLLRPYILRRLKSDVEKQLPGKFEHIVYCRLSKRQRFLYDEFMSRAQTKETLASGNFLSIVNCLMQLRKVCNHPDLFEVRPIVTSFRMTRSAIADHEIKELLVRRRLLQEEPLLKLNLDVCGLAITAQENTSVIAAQDRFFLDGTSQLPCISELPGEPPPMDTRTIDGHRRYRVYQERAQTVARWKQIAYINRSRCSRRPIYSSEMLAIARSLYEPLVPPGIAELDQRTFLDKPTISSRMVKSYLDRSEEVAGVVNRFAFATPAVVAQGLPEQVLRGAEAPLELIRNDTDFDRPLHQSTVKLQIAFPDLSLLQYDCGKLQELDLLLRERKAGGHRVLIFTQMTRVLDVLESFLNFHGYRYLRLDGTTKVEQRQIITERFNVDNRIFAFIASSRSGGVGINLTGADTVIFYDSDYNPSMDRQCEDRAHRIGQVRDVHIYRFISQHTVEESMLRKANQKRSLDDIVIQQGEFDWRKLMVDDAQMEQALARVEDVEDVEAAKLAAEEFSHDRGDFLDESGPGAQSADTRLEADLAMETNVADEDEQAREEGEGEGDDDGGSVAQYMISFVERDWSFFSDWRIK